MVGHLTNLLEQFAPLGVCPVEDGRLADRSVHGDLLGALPAGSRPEVDPSVLGQSQASVRGAFLVHGRHQQVAAVEVLVAGQVVVRTQLLRVVQEGGTLQRGVRRVVLGDCRAGVRRQGDILPREDRERRQDLVARVPLDVFVGPVALVGAHDGSEDGVLGRAQQELLRPGEERFLRGVATDVEVVEAAAADGERQRRHDRGDEAVGGGPVDVLVS